MERRQEDRGKILPFRKRRARADKLTPLPFSQNPQTVDDALEQIARQNPSFRRPEIRERFKSWFDESRPEFPVT